MLVLSRPAIYALEITAQCDHRCPGCSNVYAPGRMAADAPLPASAWRELLAELAPAAAQLRITGGEPTLHPQFFEILDAAMGYDAWVTLSTHGQWADPAALLDRLRDYPRLAGLLISLHGATAAAHEGFTRTPGAFEPTVRNLRRAAERGFAVATSTVLTRFNWHSVDAIVRLAERLGARQAVFNRYIGPARPQIEPRPGELRAALERIEALRGGAVEVRYGIGVPPCFAPNSSEGCLAGKASAAVDPWGRLRPCPGSPTIVGSLRTDSLDALWHGPAMAAWRARVPEPCVTACRARAVCGGGCRAARELRADGRDPLRGAPLRAYASPVERRSLPAEARPVADVRLRPEPFGYAVLGRGHVLAAGAAASAVIADCDGTRTFAELVTQHGPAALALLGELWSRGMLRTEA